MSFLLSPLFSPFIPPVAIPTRYLDVLLGVFHFCLEDKLGELQ